MNSFKYSGLWWLPSQQEHKVPGMVEFIEDDRINLSLDGLLEPEQDSGLLNPSPFKKHSLILGLTDDGLTVTLLDCIMALAACRREQKNLDSKRNLLGSADPATKEKRLKRERTPGEQEKR